MANTYTGSNNADNSTDAAFRAWGKWISDQLAAMGFVKTGDSGQIDWATVAKPTAGATFMGYEVWRFDDAFQSAFPVYFRIDYGSGSSQTYPAVKILMGGGSSGAGVISLRPGYQVTLDMSATLTASPRNWACGLASQGRFVFYMWDNGGVNLSMLFGIERSRDSDGNLTGAWATLVYSNTYNNNGGGDKNGSQTMSPAAVCVDGRSRYGWICVGALGGTGIKGSNWNVFPVWGSMGQTWLGPLISLVVVPKAAVTAASSFTASHYAATRTFMPGANPDSNTQNKLLPYATTNNHLPAILWE